MLGALLYHLGSFFARILPGDVPRRVACVIGRASWLTRVRTRRVVRRNLRIVHGETASDEDLSALVRSTILNFATCIGIFLELPSMDWEDVRSRCDFTEFEAAMETIDGPFIITTAHVGPWELGGYCLSRMGYRVHTVALDHPSRYVTRFFSRRRAMFGIQAYPLKNSFARLEEAIAAGDCVALIVDRAYGNARQSATFFGVSRDFPLGHAILSTRTGAPVLTGAIVLDGKRRYRYVHGGAHYPDGSLAPEENIGRLQQACLRDLEPIVRRYSDQWFHFRDLGARRRRHGTQS